MYVVKIKLFCDNFHTPARKDTVPSQSDVSPISEGYAAKHNVTLYKFWLLCIERNVHLSMRTDPFPH